MMLDFIRYQLLFSDLGRSFTNSLLMFYPKWVTICLCLWSSILSVSLILCTLWSYCEPPDDSTRYDDYIAWSKGGCVLFIMLFLSILVLFQCPRKSTAADITEFNSTVMSEFFTSYNTEIEQLDTWQEKLSLYDTYVENESLKEVVDSEWIENEFPLTRGIIHKITNTDTLSTFILNGLFSIIITILSLGITLIASLYTARDIHINNSIV